MQAAGEAEEEQAEEEEEEEEEYMKPPPVKVFRVDPRGTRGAAYGAWETIRQAWVYLLSLCYARISSIFDSRFVFKPWSAVFSGKMPLLWKYSYYIAEILRSTDCLS